MASVTHPPVPPQQEEVDINLNDPQVGEAAKKIQNAFKSRRLDKKPNPDVEKVIGSAHASG